MNDPQTSKAKMVLCECGKHGRIVYDDGLASLEFCSVSLAQHAAVSAVTNKRICDQVYEDIVEQTNAMKLPLDDGDADAKLLRRIMWWNALMADPEPRIRTFVQNSNFHYFFDN